MCELLAMSANVSTDICFSFAGLAKRGGETGPHKDGFGITFYEGKGYRTFKDALPSCQSAVADLIQQYAIKSCSVISHIRQANRGGIKLENTHPFTRELWGRHWTFAHNGQLTDYENLETGRYVPVGETDSELAFCFILNELEQQFRAQPEIETLSLFLAEIARRLMELGVFNCLLTDGELVFCFCSNNLHWITRRAPFGQAQLKDADISVDFSRVTTDKDVVTVIATQPLTDNEQWSKMKQGEFVCFYQGKVAVSGQTL